MKTAEEWFNSLNVIETINRETGINILCIDISPSIINNIQLDAWKQGMMDAITAIKDEESAFNDDANRIIDNLEIKLLTN